MVAAILGAFIGDAAGYYVGHRWGRKILRGSVGRLPIIKHRMDEDLDAAQAFLERKGGLAVFISRFTVALRVLVPGLAGTSKLRYRTFTLYNGLGAIVWGGGFVLLGYPAGTAWKRVESGARWLGTGLLIVIVAGAIVAHLFRTCASRRKKDLSNGSGSAEARRATHNRPAPAHPDPLLDRP